MTLLQTNTPVTFYIVRHGETDWNVAGRMQGQADIHLNDTGCLQAAELAALLQHVPFTSCYSSDLQRAYKTAKIILDEKNHNISIVTDQRLRERDFRHWEGKFFTDFHNAPIEERATIETHQEVLTRVMLSLHEIASNEKEGNILVLTHGGIICNLLLRLLNLDPQTYKVFVKNTGYAKVVFSNNQLVTEEMYNVEILEPSVL